MTQEEFNKLMQSKEEVKVIIYTDSSSVGLCFTLNEIVNLVLHIKENKIMSAKKDKRRKKNLEGHD